MAAAAAVLWACTPAGTALAGIDDYRFELVTPEAKSGVDSVIEVRLVDTRTGSPIADAVIVAKRIDMEPDGMATMAASLEAVPGSTPGHYRFRTALSMAGGWRLSLAAKVQGETGTVVTRLVIKAVE